MKNDITGDEIKSRAPSKEYLTNYDRIFGNGKKEKSGHQQNKVKSKDAEAKKAAS
jgi:hypothetical protein